MAEKRTNPRRRPSSDHAAPIPSLFGSSKAATFNQGRAPAAPSDPILNIPSLPHRAPTCVKGELEALVENNETRIQEFLDSIEESLRGLQKFSISGDDKDGQLANTTSEKLKQTSTFALSARISQKHHTSDSGIGSSESSEAEHEKKDMSEAPTRPSAVDTDMDNEGSEDSAGQGVLSEYACKQIQRHIISPILQVEKLKPFHPLVKHLPLRIAERKITTLRDLERVIFWLAPKYSLSAKAFLDFSQLAIQCIYATAPHLNQSEQNKPHQQPYTNRYFLDLTEQVRQFAQMICRQRDATTGKHVQLVGGLARTGKHAELTYTKDGKMYSLRTGDEVTVDTTVPGLKRFVGEEYDDDVERSMARRKKNAPPEKTVQKCSDCGKVFKRPCDLSKHEKTHSRPWKCSDESCKYYEYGWPTEKERDRHVNDKHSDNPNMYKCLYTPCPYESKRESNCKQHMEKAHGWHYSRTKSNGKGPRRTTLHKAPMTPQMSTPGSYSFTAPSPALTAQSSSITKGTDTPLMDFAQPILAYQPEAPQPTYQAPAQLHTPQLDLGPLFGPLSSNFHPSEEDPLDLNNLNFDPLNAASPSSWDSTFGGDQEMKDEDSIFGNNFDWANQDLTSLNVHLVSPTTATDSSVATPAQIQDFSPAQGKMMLPTPRSLCLESPAEVGFEDFAQTSKDDGGQDFALFSEKHARFDPNASTPLFGEISVGDHYGLNP